MNLTKIYDTEEFPLGAIHDDSKGNVYEFVKYHQGDGAVTATAGHIGYLASSGTTTVATPTVTEDHDTTTAIDSQYMNAYGAFCSALSNGKFGWIQKKGLSAIAALTNTTVAVAEQIQPADADGTIAGISVNTAAAPCIGYCILTAGDAGGTSIAAGGILWNFPN